MGSAADCSAETASQESSPEDQGAGVGPVRYDRRQACHLRVRQEGLTLQNCCRSHSWALAAGELVAGLKCVQHALRWTCQICAHGVRSPRSPSARSAHALARACRAFGRRVEREKKTSLIFIKTIHNLTQTPILTTRG